MNHGQALPSDLHQKLTLLGAGHHFLRGLLPPRGSPLSWRQLRPRSALHWMSCLLLWAIFLTYVGFWIEGHWGMLFDLLLQNDDARTTLFPFHRYGPEGALRDDPIANKALGQHPPAQHLIYRVLVPLVGLYAASKVIQLLCLLIVVGAAIVVARSKRAGLASALLLIFFVLHAPFMIDRIAGGHMRGFAFPLIALWLAGALARSERTRFVATALAAPLYAPAAGLMLAAEGLLAVQGGLRFRSRPFRARLKRYGLLVMACVMLVMPQVLTNRPHDRLHTLAEAQKEPAFIHSPRRVLPFPEPALAAAWHFVHPFRAAGRRPVPMLASLYAKLDTTGPLLIVGFLVILITMRLAPTPWPAIAFSCGTIVMYALARVLAFRLYNPERYYSVGMEAASMMLVVSTVGLLWPAHRECRRRAIVRNLATGLFMALWCGLAGDGIIRNNGMTIDGREHAELYVFVRTLPVDARIACHPGDGAGVSYWSARATTYHHETLQPWFVEPWQRSKALTEETLRSLYSTSPHKLLAYCDRYHITHLLIHTDRYSDNFKENAKLWPPFDECVAELLSGVERDQLVIPKVPQDAVLFYHQPWVIVDVARLRKVWTGLTSAGSISGLRTQRPCRRALVAGGPLVHLPPLGDQSRRVAAPLAGSAMRLSGSSEGDGRGKGLGTGAINLRNPLEQILAIFVV